MFLKRFKKTENPKKTFVIIHGLGEHSGRYRFLIDKLLNLNYQIITFDLPGHGFGKGKKGYIEDFYKIYDYIEEITPEKFILYGHSMGGLIVLRYTEYAQKKPEKLILSSPAVGKLYTSFQKILLNTLGIFGKITIKNGIDPKDLCHDDKAIKEYLDDPLVHNKIAFRTAKQLFFEAEKALEEAEKINIPVLLQFGGMDKVINIDNCEELSEKLNTVIVQKHKYAKHEVHNEPKYKDKYLLNILDFIES
ncbi:Lysophospholipase, alpha-beta hydrolase superfamily [Marinitoga hydrogenitolerans DSM 16785]|uniref:Lysophospholipase, alpha-beta hydrolase superfamily n=1 Tax=Marinitoga hydrogenitolerans (strain DSM 16785 / JCM 12826 / AT1271) TaxID=1122195 RepID=A0A1M4VVH8_MARH1|nr:alpha/beta fold hydrolase [Marinitoga hydrogenitolerans]SHE72920.1 Lysophospholipase, alpha-beta hydrolase superfamily [Marinitoga hydrogenitolerans DSM 16785]